ncbi:MAG TPA: DUF6569 family protein [Verrucomicrobiae bacterium]|nr:DUF6569 family protein [Verrucomicrobiae bacterium]
MSKPSHVLNFCLNLVVLAAPVAAADPQITGPFKHANLSIYLIHSGAKPTVRPLLTLQEAMAQKKTVVYETGEVNELSIENTSSQDVFIQSGDIVKGGRQDRVLTTDFILPAHSGKLPITAFCVEQGRWTKRGNEAADQFTSSNAAVPGKSLKMAVRAGNSSNQGEVWTQVAAARQSLGGISSPRPAGRTESFGAASRDASTSMQIALEDNAKTIEAYTRDLFPLAAGQNDVVGFAYAINGKLNSADVYDSHDLFVRMWPKLLAASAAEAVEDQAKAQGTADDPEISAVREMMSSAERAPAASKQATGRATVIKRETDQTLLFETSEKSPEGEWMHRSYVMK